MHSGASDTSCSSPSGCLPTLLAHPSTSVNTIRLPDVESSWQFLGHSYSYWKLSLYCDQQTNKNSYFRKRTLRTKSRQVILCQCSNANSIIFCSRRAEVRYILLFLFFLLFVPGQSALFSLSYLFGRYFRRACQYERRKREKEERFDPDHFPYLTGYRSINW